MNLEQLKAALKTAMDRFDELGKIRAEGKSYTDEQLKELGDLRDEVKRINADIDKLTGGSAYGDLAGLIEAYRTAPAKNTPGVIDTATDSEPSGLALRNEMWHDFYGSEGYKEVALKGVGKSGLFALGKEIGLYARADPEGFLADYPDAVKTLVYSGQTGIAMGGLQQPMLIPGIQRGDSRVNRVRDAFTVGSTSATSIIYVSENVVTNNAAAIIEATSITAGAPAPAGARFPESAITFTQATETVKNIGHMIPVTKEMLQDVPLMDNYLRMRMIEMLDDKVDQSLVTGAGGNDLTGIANISGITDLNGAYWTANPLVSAGAPAENADRIRRAKTYLRQVVRVGATHVIINPYDLENIELARDTNGNYMFGGVVGQNGTFSSRIAGLTVVESESVAEGVAYVVSKPHNWVLDKLETTVEVTDSNRDWWEFRILALAVWTRLAFLSLRPAAIAKVTLL